jgi:membrane associated rhomboid family serine protease
MNRINLTPVVKQILIACIVLYIGTALLKYRQIFDLDTVLAMHYPLHPDFRPWQIITHMFMHDSNGLSPHLLFNMFALVSIGTIVERYLGSKKFLQLFLYAGFGSIALHIIVESVMVHNAIGEWFPSFSSLDIQLNAENNPFTYSSRYTQESFDVVAMAYFSKLLGASGAIYGVIVAFAFFFPNTELMFMFIPYPVKAKYLVPIMIGLDIYLGVSNFGWDPVAHFAHIGGALTGLAIVWYWRKFDRTNFY